ncbi:CAP [Carabus blaptoides fortunei]
MSTREITLDGGSPWGFRMHGGADVQQPLRISRVNPGSKAAQRGIREGDFISSINGQSTRGITNQEAHALLRNAGDTLTLGLNQENIGSPKRRVQKIQQDSKEDSLKRSSIASTSSALSNISTINRILSNSYQSNESSTHTTNGLGTPREAEQFTADYISYKKNNGTSTSTSRGVWSPGKGAEPKPAVPDRASPEKRPSPPKEPNSDEPVPVVWTPRSAGSSPTAERKEFRPVSFESPVLGRKNKSKESTPVTTPDAASTSWEGKVEERTQDVTTTLSLERRLTTSHSAPAAGLNNLSKLPRAQNPTITLLQKAREGQLPRGALYIEQQQQHLNQKQRSSKDDRPPLIGPNEILYTVKNEYMSESDSEKPKKMADLGPRKFEGIGPTTKDGMPIVLRSEIKDANQAKWYKRMYDTLHRSRHDDEYVTVRYKTHRGRYPYTSAGGYLSEPEPNVYDRDVGISASKYATLDRRRLQPNRDKENEYITYTIPRNKYMSASVKHSTDIYKNQPGRIEDYVPGHSSISEKEAKEWWDEVMEIFDGHLEQQKHVPSSKSYMSHALKESGYESDSTLVFRRREDAALQLNPHDQKEAYKTIQRGGEVPLHGLRKPAPERPKEPVLGPTPPPKGRHDIRDIGPESPRKYVEDEVTIHYRSPVRHEIKEVLSEEELARRQAEAMRRIYQEERRRKYLQELQDMNSRRHTDNFIPSQKSPIPLNRYDDFVDDLSLKVKPRDRSPEPRLVARALYNFVGQSSRELTFRKGDIIFIRRQVDKNWYEGEHNAMIGLFPFNYVEIIPYDGIKSTPRKAHEGQARAKFNFIAQTHLELSLAKGELVVLTRRVDDNWYEGRIGSRKGIFPVSYVEMLIDPHEKQQDATSSSKPVASPAAHSLLLNGSAGGKESMGSHHYQPSYTAQPTTTSYHAKPVNVIGTSASYTSLSKAQKLSTPSVNEALHIDTHSEPVPYRALYKYRPQNDDELELQEGDTVFVLEKCDDGWYVGSSQRTGAFEVVQTANIHTLTHAAHNNLPPNAMCILLHAKKRPDQQSVTSTNYSGDNMFLKDIQNY